MTTIASPRPPGDVLRTRTATTAGLRLRDVLFRGYLAALFGPVAFFALRDAVTGFAALLGSPLPLTDPAAASVTGVLAGAAAAALAAGVHTGVWRGPFSLDRADVAWLLASPLPRQALVRPRLRSAALRSAVLGATAGAVAGPLAATALGGAPLPAAVAAGAGGSCLALLGLAGAWWPVLRPDHAARVLRAATVGGGGAVMLAAAALALPALSGVLVWSGPWGWAASATVSAAAGGLLPAAVPLVPTVALAAVAVRSMLATAGQAPAEGLARPTGAAAGATAAAYMLDLAAVVEIRREALDVLRPIPRWRIPVPRRPALAVVWRDATSLLRTPGRTLAALAGVAVGGLLAVTGIGVAATSDGTDAAFRAPTLIALGVVVTQVAAGTLAAPLRSALSRPFGHLHLPWSHLTLVRRHLAVPMVVLTVWGALATGAAAAVVGRQDLPLTILGAALVAPVLVLAAALRTLRPPRAPAEVAEAVLTNEYGALAFAIRSWPRALVVAALTAAATVLASAPLPPRVATVLVIVGAGSAITAAWWRLSRKAAPWG